MLDANGEKSKAEFRAALEEVLESQGNDQGRVDWLLQESRALFQHGMSAQEVAELVDEKLEKPAAKIAALAHLSIDRKNFPGGEDEPFEESLHEALELSNRALLIAAEELRSLGASDLRRRVREAAS
jgi:hypothetical protein